VQESRRARKPAPLGLDPPKADASLNTCPRGWAFALPTRTDDDGQRATAHEARTMAAAPSAESVSGENPGPPGRRTDEVLGSGGCTAHALDKLVVFASSGGDGGARRSTEGGAPTSAPRILER